jgi:HAD superfamily hydrolase (TIGR01484 family)
LKSINEISNSISRSVKGFFSDIDDTITTDGVLGGDAYVAIENISKKGIHFVPITGRPAGWCDMIARFWPVKGVIGENGAFYFSYDHKKKKMIRRYIQNEKVRSDGQKKLSEIKHKILNDVPGCAVSSDQFSRISDLAIDFCEDVPELSMTSVRKIRDIFVEAGATAKISSIHVNAWFGDYNKLEMTRIFAKEVLNLDLDQNKDSFVFCGDSPNDEPLFEYFPNSCGVANVQDFKSEMIHLPKYVAKSRGGKGFVEICEKFLGV